MRPPKGYWNLHQAVETAKLAAEEWNADFGTAVAKKGAKSVLQGLEISSFRAALIRGMTPADVLREALECGELLSAGIRERDGQLVTIPTAVWRRPFSGREPIGSPLERHRRAIHGRREPLRNAFDEALAGRNIPTAADGRNGSDGWALPIIAQADLDRWMGEDPGAEPVERPADWPERLRPSAGITAAELIRAFVRGYAAATLTATGKPVARDDGQMKAAAIDALPGCKVDGIRAAYADLPRDLRNPRADERQAEKGGARK